MQIRPLPLGLLLLALISPFSSAVAQDSGSKSADVSIPRVIRLQGSLPPSTPVSRVVGLTFALYKNEQGGTPLWLETQSVSADAQGRFSVLLGAKSKDGLPAEVFLSTEARWLEVKAEGADPLPRTLLVSVPYALKAGDANTLGGMTPAEIMAMSQPLEMASVSGSASPAIVVRSARPARSPDSTASSLGPRGSVSMNEAWQLVVEAYDDETHLPLPLLLNPKGGNVGIGTTTPGQKLSVAGTIESAGGFKFPDATVQMSASNLTGIAAGTGLSGGGSSGNISLSADFNAVQARIASSCPAGTAMGSIAANGIVSCNAMGGGGGGGATLGANTFTGQNVFTSVPTGAAVGQGPVYINPASAETDRTLFGIAVNDSQKFRIDSKGGVTGSTAYFGGSVFRAIVGEGSAVGVTYGIWGNTASTAGTGIRADASASTGQTFGLNATASSDDGAAVSGFNNSTATAAGALGLGPVGVKGKAQSSVGVGVEATSPYVGIHATTGTLFPSVSGAGTAAGLFDTLGTADLIVGRSGMFALATKFRVDSDGAVYSNSYKDLAGNIVAPAVYSADGTPGGKSVFGRATASAGGTVTVTLSSSAVFSSNTSYACVVTGASGSAAAGRVSQTSASQFTITGTAGADYNYVCMGR